jgi:acyl-CoA dehydrogenase
VGYAGALETVMTSPLTSLTDRYLTDEHDAFRAMCRRFTESVLIPGIQQWEEDEFTPKDIWKQAGDAGMLGPTLPADLGGCGGDALHALVWTEEVMRCGSGGLLSGLGSLEIALPAIVHLGTSEQQERWVRPVTSGERVAALGITEPAAGSDVAGLRTRAVRDGDDYVINGSKTFITSGIHADQVTVLARTSDDRHGGLTFFVVETDRPGFSVSKALKKTGWRASDTAELSFDDLRVPLGNRLGVEGTGFVQLMRTFEGERLALAAQGCAIAEICYQDALSYARQRMAFGKTLTGFQVTRHKLARMATQVVTAKALTYAVAEQMRQGIACPVEAAMAKNTAADIAMSVSYDAVQIFGGAGYMRETRVERLSRDARLLPIGGGTSEVMNEIIGKGLGL